MTLEQLPPGACGRIVSIDVGWGLRRRLEQMGLQLGDLVSVTSRAPFRGPLLICTRGTQTALGRGVARRIEVVAATVDGGRAATADDAANARCAVAANGRCAVAGSPPADLRRPLRRRGGRRG